MRWATLALILCAAATAHCGPLSAGEHRSRAVRGNSNASIPAPPRGLRAAPVPAIGKIMSCRSAAAVPIQFRTCSGRRSPPPAQRTGGNGGPTVASVAFSRRHAAARNASTAATARVPAPVGSSLKCPLSSECAGIGDSGHRRLSGSAASRARRSLHRSGRASSPADRALNQWRPARGRQGRDVA